MPLTESNLPDLLGQHEEAFGTSGGGSLIHHTQSGSGGGGLGDKLIDPLGLDAQDIFKNLSTPVDAISNENVLQQKIGAPPDLSRYKNLSQAQLAGLMHRAQLIHQQVPQANITYVMNHLDVDMDGNPTRSLDDTIRAIKAATAASNPRHKSWWDHVVHNPVTDTIGHALHATFIAGPEWLYDHLTVSSFRALGEIGGIDPRHVRHLSPGQIALALGDRLVGGHNVWKKDERGHLVLKRRGEWSKEAGFISGAFDFLSRNVLDPTQLALNVFLPGLGAAKIIEEQGLRAFRFSLLGGISLKEASTAGAIRGITRLQMFRNADDAYKRASSIMTSGRAGAFLHWITRDIPAREFLHTLIRGNSNLSEIIDFAHSTFPVYKKGRDLATWERKVTEWRDRMLLRYASHSRGGWGNGAHVFASMETDLRLAAKKGGNLREAATEGMIGSLTRRPSQIEVNRVSQGVRQAAQLELERERALDTFFNSHRFFGEATDVRPPDEFMRVDGIGSVRSELMSLVKGISESPSGIELLPGDFLAHLDLNGTIDENNILSAVKSAVERLAAKRGPERDAIFADLKRRLGDNLVDDFAEQVKNERELLGVERDLNPWFKQAGLSASARNVALDSIDDVMSNLTYVQGMSTFPMRRVFAGTLDKLGEDGHWKSLRRLTARALTAHEWSPAQQVDVHSPWFFEQIEKAGRKAGMAEDEIASAVSGLSGAESPTDVQTIFNRYTRAIYKKMGLRDEDIEYLYAHAPELDPGAYGINAAGEMLDTPQFVSQNRNVSYLINPSFLNSVAKLMREARPATGNMEDYYRGLRRQITKTADSWTNLFRRMKVAMPRTGLRIDLEQAAFSAMAGYRSPLGNPITYLLTLAAAPFSPKRAMGLSRSLSPKAIRDVAIDVRDLGAARSAYSAGLLSKSKYDKLRTLDWEKEFKNAAPRKRNAYRENQAAEINDFVLNDELAKRIILNGEDDALRWLKTSPDAAQYRETVSNMKGAPIYDPGIEGRVIGHAPADLDTHYTEVLEQMKRLRVLDPEVRGKILADGPQTLRKLTPGDLLDHEAPHVIGSDYVDYGKHHLDQVWDKVISRNLTDIQNISRDYTFRRELNAEVWRQVSRVDAQRTAGKALDHDAILSLVHGNVVANRPIETALVQNARNEVYKRMRFLFDDLSAHNRYAEALKHVFPFFNATEQVFSRWGRMMSERPWVPHLGSVMLDNAEKVFTHKDPNTGETMIAFPGSHWLMRMAGMTFPNPYTGMKDLVYTLAGPLKGISIATNPIQGASPVVDIPMRFLKKYIPTSSAIYDFLYPYGDPSTVNNYLPSGFAEVTDLVKSFLDETPDKETQFGRLYSDMLNEEIYGAARRFESGHTLPGDEDLLGNIGEYLKRNHSKILNRARIAFIIRAASAMNLPLRMTEHSPAEDIIAFHRFVSDATGDPDLADDAVRGYLLGDNPQFSHDPFDMKLLGQLVGKGPIKSSAFKALLAPRAAASDEDEDRLPMTTGFANLLKDPKTKDIVKLLGSPIAALFHETSLGDYSREAFEQAVKGGELHRLSPDIRAKKAQRLVAFSYYFEFKQRLDDAMLRAGIPPGNTSKGAKIFTEADNYFKRRLGLLYPNLQGDLDEIDKTRKSRHIAALWVIATTPAYQRLDGARGLAEYFKARQQLNAALSRNGLRSLKSKKSIEYLRSWKVQVNKIAQRHPWFRPLWTQFLQRDDPSVPLIGKNGILVQSKLLGPKERAEMERLGLLYPGLEEAS